MYLPLALNIYLLHIVYVQCANILGVFTFPSISHQRVFQTIWRELSLKGHKVTVVTPNPLNDPALKNLTEIGVQFAYEILKDNKLVSILSKATNVFRSLVNVHQLLEVVAETEVKSAQFQELINNREKKFDLILVECHQPVMYALAERYKAPIIGFSSMRTLTMRYDSVGNPNHPVLYPELKSNFLDKKLSMWQKVNSVALTLWQKCYLRSFSILQAQKIAKTYFKTDISDLSQLERNISMLLVSGNSLIYPPRPFVPNLVEMEQTHIKTVKPLPKDLKQILDESKEGVIYFNLGSNVKSVNLREDLRDIIVQVFSELPYKIIWKWEADYLPAKPSNVIIRKWLPQQDILAHPKVRVFITQGGFQSIEEAISRKVPLVGMPFMNDQPSNVQKIVTLGIGLAVDPSTVSKDELKKSIVNVAENIKFKEKINQISDLLHDQPMRGIDKAVWWSEYVIRHKGAKFLRSSRVDISWIEYLLLDVVFTVLTTASIMTFISLKLVNKLRTVLRDRNIRT